MSGKANPQVTHIRAMPDDIPANGVQGQRKQMEFRAMNMDGETSPCEAQLKQRPHPWWTWATNPTCIRSLLSRPRLTGIFMSCSHLADLKISLCLSWLQNNDSYYIHNSIFLFNMLKEQIAISQISFSSNFNIWISIKSVSFVILCMLLDAFRVFPELALPNYKRGPWHKMG